MNYSFKKHIIITGHYGSGKTNIAIALALLLSTQGKKCALVDIDTVNPYFRAFDAAELLRSKGVAVIAPVFANTNLDVPSLPGEINAVFDSRYDHAIFDVGGDDAGAYALGQYSGRFTGQGYTMLYVINKYRPLTSDTEETAQVLYEIESASRLKACGLINNSNLGVQTTSEVVTSSYEYAQEVSKMLHLPIAFTTIIKNRVSGLAGNILEIELNTKAKSFFDE